MLQHINYFQLETEGEEFKSVNMNRENINKQLVS